MIRILLPLTLIAVPLIEIALFVIVGGQIGLLATVAVVIATALAGTALLRVQGLEVLAQARRAAKEGRMPIESVIDGVFLFAAGLLLLTPGFLTDAIGFVMFVPPLRRAFAGWIWHRLLASGSFAVFSAGGATAPGAAPNDRQQPPGPPPVIEGDYVEIEETDERRGGGKR